MQDAPMKKKLATDSQLNEHQAGDKRASPDIPTGEWSSDSKKAALVEIASSNEFAMAD